MTLGGIAGERGNLTLWAWRCRAARRLAQRLEVSETLCVPPRAGGCPPAEPDTGRGCPCSTRRHGSDEVRPEVGNDTDCPDPEQSWHCVEPLVSRSSQLHAGEETVPGRIETLALQGGYRREEARAYRLAARRPHAPA